MLDSRQIFLWLADQQSSVAGKTDIRNCAETSAVTLSNIVSCRDRIHCPTQAVTSVIGKSQYQARAARHVSRECGTLFRGICVKEISTADKFPTPAIGLVRVLAMD